MGLTTCGSALRVGAERILRAGMKRRSLASGETAATSGVEINPVTGSTVSMVRVDPGVALCPDICVRAPQSPTL